MLAIFNVASSLCVNFLSETTFTYLKSLCDRHELLYLLFWPPPKYVDSTDDPEARVPILRAAVLAVILRFDFPLPQHKVNKDNNTVIDQ